MNTIQCNSCGKSLRVRGRAGKGRCPACGHFFELTPAENSASAIPMEVETASQNSNDDAIAQRAKKAPRRKMQSKRKQTANPLSGRMYSLWIVLGVAAGLGFLLLFLRFFFSEVQNVIGFLFLALLIGAPFTAKILYHIDSGDNNWFMNFEAGTKTLLNFVYYPQLGLMLVLAFVLFTGSGLISGFSRPPREDRIERQNNINDPKTDLAKKKELEPEPKTQQPITLAHWSFDEGSGTTALDSSAMGQKGSLFQTKWVDGVRGKALEFDGANSFVDLGTNDALNFAENASFTFMAWFKTMAPEGQILTTSLGADANDMLHIRIRTGRMQILIQTHDNKSRPDAIESMELVNDGRWHHFAFTRQPTEFDLYIDGKQISKRVARKARSIRGALNSDTRLVGKVAEHQAKYTRNHPNCFRGCIDELVILGHAASQEEIDQYAKMD